MAATCTAPGKTEGSHCSLCGEILVAQQPVDALGHDMTFTAAAPATDCQHTGKVAFYHCSRCKKDFADEAGANELTDLDDHTAGPHKPVTDAAVDPTCTETGLTEGSHCELCGTVLTAQETVDALGHQMTHNAAAPATDCQHTGTVAFYHCSRCKKDFADEAGANELTDLDDHTAGPHKPVTDAAVDPTCTETGLTEGSHCELCGTVLTAQETVDALGHDWSDWTLTAEPKCVENGVETRICARCNETETRDVDALGHDWSAWETVKEATVAEEGLERRICYRCHEIETRAIPRIEGQKDRKVQFVVSEDMHYLVHMDGYDYAIYSKTTPVIDWYSTAPLTFEVVPEYGFRYDGYVVLVNQVELAPNADGTFTLPAGTDYTMISIAPVMELPAIDNINGNTESGACKYCGKVHPGHLWGRLVALVHAIIYFFMHLFGRM